MVQFGGSNVSVPDTKVLTGGGRHCCFWIECSVPHVLLHLLTILLDITMIPYWALFLVDCSIRPFSCPLMPWVIQKGEANRFRLAEMAISITNTHLFSIPTACSAASNQSKLMWEAPGCRTAVLLTAAAPLCTCECMMLWCLHAFSYSATWFLTCYLFNPNNSYATFVSTLNSIAWKHGRRPVRPPPQEIGCEATLDWRWRCGFHCCRWCRWLSRMIQVMDWWKQHIGWWFWVLW
jgi:hypothetical protein